MTIRLGLGGRRTAAFVLESWMAEAEGGGNMANILTYIMHERQSSFPHCAAVTWNAGWVYHFL